MDQSTMIGAQSSLFSMMMAGRDPEVIIDEWIGEYKRLPDDDDALVQLLQMFISSAGCNGVITAQMISEADYEKILEHMADEFDGDNGALYPLIQIGPQWEKFPTDFGKFLMLLMDKCRRSILFDRRMMNSVLKLLVPLSTSKVRAFRHTAIFATLKLTSALVDVRLDLERQSKDIDRQMEVEKTDDNQLALRMVKGEADEKCKIVQDMLQCIDDMIDPRFRDVLPDIRSLCIEELGNWICTDPEHFLNDDHLKYIRFLLYDKYPIVRFKCVSALMPLYEREEEKSKRLAPFTGKMKNRLLEMITDDDVEVAIKACQLIAHISRCFPRIVTLEDCSPIYVLVFAADRNLAVVAGEWLNAKVLLGGGSRRSPSKIIDNLVVFFMDSERSLNSAPLLVDALIDVNPVLKDWKCMGKKLLDYDGADAESTLIAIMVCSANQAISGESPEGRTPTKEVNDGEKRMQADDRKRLTVECIPLISALLKKYIADRDNIASLLEIPLLFELEIYVTRKLNKNLDELVQTLEAIIERHSDEAVLSAVASVFDHFAQNTEVRQLAEKARHRLFVGVAVELRRRVQHFSDKDHPDEEDAAALLASVRRIAALAAWHDLSRLNLWDVCYGLAAPSDDPAKAAAVSPEVREQALIYCSLALTWDLGRLTDTVQPDRDREIECLGERRGAFVAAATEILLQKESGCEMAFLVLCDTLLRFNANLDDDLQPLLFHMDPVLEGRLVQFVCDTVFEADGNMNDTTAKDKQAVDKKEQTAKINKRRNLLAQFCKLIVRGAIGMHTAAYILKYYTKFSRDYGDIMTYLLMKCKEKDKIMCGRIVVSALSYCFDGLMADDSTVDPLSVEFSAVRDLAKRFSQLIGGDLLTDRLHVQMIHREGIAFALGQRWNDKAPTEISFLEVIGEFSTKLLPDDRPFVQRYLDKFAQYPLCPSYAIYRRSLEGDSTPLANATRRNRY